MPSEFERLATEGPNPDTADLDAVHTLGALTLMNREDMRVARAVESVLPQIAIVVDAIVARLRKGGRLIYVGAGTSGRLGVLDAVECPPTFGTHPSVVQGLIAGGQGAMFAAVEGAEDSPEVAEEALRALNINHQDVVFALSASGRTPFAIGALRFGKAMGALTVALSCNLGARMSEEAELAIEVDTGPEVLHGSTRLKAGSAQKMVLNMVSTCTMVQLGKVYRNLMVDLHVSNVKLEARAKRVLMMVLDIDEATAATVLDRAAGNVKRGIVMHALGLDPQGADEALSAHGGFVRDVLGQGRAKSAKP